MMTQTRISNPHTFRPANNFVTFGALAAFLVGIDYAAWATSSRYYGIDATLWVVSLLVLLWISYIRPRIIFFDEGLTIINPTKSHTLSWKSVENIDTGLTLVISTRSGSIKAWAATGPSRRVVRKTMRGSGFNGFLNSSPKIKLGDIDPRTLGLESGHHITAADLPDSDSGAAAATARLKQRSFNNQTQPTVIENMERRIYALPIFGGVIGCIAIIMLAAKK